MKELKKLKDLEKVLSDDDFYNVREMFEIYAFKKYDYLAIRVESWENIVVLAIEDIMKKGISSVTLAGEISIRLEKAVKNYILNEIKIGSARIFNNLLIKIKRERYKQSITLKAFLREFELLGINFTSGLYDLLKEQSEQFRILLNNLDILEYSYIDFACYLKGNNTSKSSASVKKGTKHDSRTNIKLRKTPTKVKGLYERFDDYNYVLPVEKKMIIDYFVNRLSEVKRSLVLNGCKGLLFTKDMQIANGIISNVKVLYKKFVETGYLPEESLTLRELYNNILRRKNGEIIEAPVNNDNEGMLKIIEEKFGIQRKALFVQQLNLLERYFLEKGYTKEGFYTVVGNIINILESYPVSSSSEYMRLLIDMIYGELNIHIIRA